MIPQSFIEEIQSRTDIVELISSYIPLKRAGRNFKALCPFHNEKTASFFVSPQKQIFHCFGCGEGGGCIQFVMLYEKVSFTEAVEILAKRLGLEVPHQKVDKNKISLYEVVKEASIFFHKNLLENKEAQHALVYLSKRGITLETIKKFQIGYSLGKNTLLENLRKKGYTLDILEKASLIVPQNDGYRDLFCERIIFPIFDVRSRVVGFGARTLKDLPDVPKYINSLENPLYSKREHLFGLNFSKDDILKNDSVIVVEGYFDMIIPFVNGIRNIVASLGTALTEEQIRLIKRYTSNVILIFDPDSAGQNATWRALDLLLEHQLKVKIVNLPDGYDPDLLVRQKGRDYFLSLLEDKLDFFDYKLEFLKKSYDIQSIDGKAKIATELLSTIYKLKSEIERYEYIKKLSQALEIKEEVLLAEAKKFAFQPNRLESMRTNTNLLSTTQPISLAEKIILKFMFTNKKAFSVVKKNLKEDDFTLAVAKKTISYFLNTNFDDEVFSSSTKLLANIQDKEICSFVTSILMDEDIPQDKELFKSSVAKLLQKRVKNYREKLKEEIKVAEKMGNKDRLKILLEQYDKVTIQQKL